MFEIQFQALSYLLEIITAICKKMKDKIAEVITYIIFPSVGRLVNRVETIPAENQATAQLLKKSR